MAVAGCIAERVQAQELQTVWPDLDALVGSTVCTQCRQKLASACFISYCRMLAVCLMVSDG
jgi:hypothetical protein